MRPVTLARHAHFVAAGQFCAELALVLRGALRLHYPRPDGEERTTYFFFENHLLADSWSYNLAHHKLPALALGAAGYLLGEPALLLAGTVLLFHSSADRLLGYGLKYESGFGDTHLGCIGKPPLMAA